MNISRYRYTLLFICITLTGVSFFTVFRWGDMSDIYSREVAPIGFIKQITSLGYNVPLTPPPPIPIQNLTSPRYLYTLIQELQKKTMTNDGKLLPIETKYEYITDVHIEGTEAVFSFTGFAPIRLPTTSYFFDIYNQRPTVSGETTNTTGATQGNQKVIALTFDDGPSEKYTHNLLDILKSHDVKATFFVLGTRVIENPEILKREEAEGHEIGNHSFSHANFTKISKEDQQDEIYKTDQAIYEVIGRYPVLFRPPYGAINTGMLADITMPFILWNIDPKDWKTKNIKKNIASIAGAKSGDIIIMHDIHEASVASIDAMIKLLKSRGFRFVTVSEILELSPSNQQTGKRCYKRKDCR